MIKVVIMPSPAPFGVGILWLDLVLGISYTFVLFKNIVDNLTVIRLIKKLIKKLIGHKNKINLLTYIFL